MAGMAVPWLLGVVLALLDSLHGVAGCPRACTCYVDTDVHCTFRYLHAVPPGLPGHVQRVNLGYNGILQLTEQSLPGLPHLEMLLLHSNSIQRLNGRVFQDLKSLTLLKLSHNKVRLLGREALRGLTSLQRLHLDHNQLEFLHPEALAGLVSLRSLFLEGNRLRQLHRDSLVTFWLPPGRLLPASSLRQLHLSGNKLRSLPRGLFSSVGELEQVFLHDNPWACDCGLQWLLDWDRSGEELLKCKRERTQGGRLCPVCASPTANRGQELFTVPQEAVSCRRPSIASPLKLRNVSLWGDAGPDGPQGRPLGKVGLDLSDNGGNRGGLTCDALRPGGGGDGDRGAKLDVSEGRLSVRATIAVRLACTMEAGDMESLWRILAYYSDSPLVLRRERTFPNERESGPSYAQASDNGLGFFSDVRAVVSGDLPWLLDSEISLKLNRRLTSATKLYLDASVEINATYDLSDLPDKKSPWVMIRKEDAAESGLIVPSGAMLEIECQSWGFPNPGVLWTFPDGTQQPAPYDGPDGRVTVSADGTLTVRLAVASDRGVYCCVARANETSDAATFRVEVVDSNVNERNANGAALTAARGQMLVLPCAAMGSPDPEVAWVLPNKHVVRPSPSPSDGTYVADNGTLVVPEVTEGGFYQCVAINKLGTERLVHKVKVTAASGEGGRVTNEIVESVEMVTSVAPPTRAPDDLAAGRYILQEVTEGHGVTVRARHTAPGPSVAMQGRREGPTSATMENKDLDNNLNDDDDDDEGERSLKTETKTLGSRNRTHSTLSRFDPGWWAKVLENVRNKISPRVRPTLSLLPHTKPPHTTSPARIEEEEEEGEEEKEEEQEEDKTEEGNKDMNSVEEGGGRSRANDELTRGSDGRAEAENEESSADDVDVAVTKFNSNPTPQTPYLPTTRPGIVYVPRAGLSPPINRIFTPKPLGEDSAMEPNYDLNSFSDGTDGQRAKWHDIRPTEKSDTATVAHIGGEHQDFKEEEEEEEEEEKKEEEKEKEKEEGEDDKKEEEKEEGEEEGEEEEEEATNSFHQEEMHMDRHHMQDPTARTASRENAATPYEPGVDELDGGSVVRDTFNSPRTDEPEAPTKSHAALPGDKSALAEATSVDGRVSLLGKHRPGDSGQPSSRGNSVETSKGGGAGSEGGGMRTGARGSAYDRTLGHSEEVERRYGPRMTHRLGETPGGAAGRNVEAAQPTQPTGKMDSGATLGRADNIGRSGRHRVETQAVIMPRPSHAFPVQGGRDEQSQQVGGASTGHVARMHGSAGNRLHLGIAREERPLHPGGVQGINHSPRRTHNPITHKPQSRQFHPQQSWQEHHHRHSNHYVHGYSPARYHPLLPKLWNFYPKRFNGAVTNRPEITALVAKPTPPFRKVISTELEDDRTRTFWNPLPPRPHSAPRVAVNSLGTTLTATERFENSQGGAGVQRSKNWHPSRRGSGNHVSGALTSEAKAIERPRQASPRSQLPNLGPRGGMRPTQQLPTPPPLARLTPLRPGFARRFGATGSGGGGSDVGHARRTDGSDAGASNDVVLDRRGVAEEAPSVTTAAGADAFLPCGTVGGGGSVDVRWIRASTGSIVASSSAPSGRRVVVLHDGTLAVRSASPGDADRYTCETPTGGSGTDRATVALRVESHPPRVLSPRWRELRVSPGGTAEAECAAQGSPPPAISWMLPDRSSVAVAAAAVAAQDGGGDGGRVSVSERATLIVRDVHPSDRGDYSCVASSAAGTDAVTVHLHVLPARPTVVRGATTVSVAAGRPLSLPCTASGWPEPAVSWALPGDGGQLLPNQRSGAGSGARVFANGTLLVPAAMWRDAGTYKCTAANVAGVDSAAVIVTVLGPPRVAAPPPGDMAVPYGGALRLRCVAEGEPRPVVVWRLPSGGTASAWFAADRRMRVLPDGSLALDGVVASDAGRYMCTVRNRHGEDSATATVSITMRPARIERHSGDTRSSGGSSGSVKQSVRHGANLRFDCVTSGSPQPRVSWSLPDGAVVPADFRAQASGDGGAAAMLAAGGARRYAVFGNGTLALSSVGLADKGDYTCYAENAVGWDAMVVHVAVEGQAPQIQDKPERAVVRITSGDSIALECRASGDPAPLITWRLPDGSQLPPPLSLPSSPRRPRSPRTPGQEAPRRAALSVRGKDSALEVHGARIADAGRYVCVAQNAAGEDSRAVRLDVLPAPPSINGRTGTSPEIKDSVPQGARKLLPCAADGDPQPHVVWITPSGAFLPVPHSSGRLLTHANGSLEIRSAARSDAGRYACVARGADGSRDARLSVDLTVMGAPAPPSFLAPTTERVEVAPGASVALACPARGEPPPQTTWTLPGGAQLARGSNRGARFSAGLDGALLVRGATLADTGVYRCSARSPSGVADRVVLLEVGPQPRITWISGSTVAALVGDTLWLHCVVAAGRASWRLPSGVTVEVPRTSGRYTLFANGTLSVRDGSTRDSGAYVCTARGAAGTAADGESRTVRVVVVAQAPRIVDGPPPAVVVLRGAPLRLPCMASGAPVPEVRWELPDGARLSTGTPAAHSARSGRYVLARGMLVVAAAAVRDAGFYRCSARNAVGEEWRRTSVRVV